jgi:hypothetical protein
MKEAICYAIRKSMNVRTRSVWHHLKSVSEFFCEVNGSLGRKEETLLIKYIVEIAGLERT